MNTLNERESNVRKSTRLFGMFSLSAVCAFVLSYSGAARSNVQTIQWLGCFAAPNRGFECPLWHSSPHPISSLVKVYYDFVADNGTMYEMRIQKWSGSSGLYQDSSTFTATSTGVVDKATYASNVLTNPNQDDRLTALVLSNTSAVIQGLGVAEVTTY